MATLWVLVRHEVLEILRQRAFALTTVLGMLLVAAAAVVPPMLMPAAGTPTVRIAVLDQGGAVVRAMAAAASAQAGTVRVRPWTASASALAQAVRADRLSAGVVVLDGPGGAPHGVRVLARSADDAAVTSASALARSAVLSVRLSAAGLSPAAVTDVLRPLRLDTVAVGPAAPFSSPAALVLTIYLFIIVLFVMIVVYGQMVLMGVSAEKASRVSEVLVVSVRPVHLMLGKVVGVGLAGLLQLAAVAAVGLGFVLFDPRLASSTGVLQGAVPLWSVGPLVVYFVLGYLFYGGLFAAIGASVRDPEEARSAVALPTIVMVMAYVGSIVGLSNVASGYVAAGSFLPPLAPWLMLERIMLGSVSWWEVAISVALLVAAIVWVFSWAAQVYRRNLTSSAPFSLWPTRGSRRAPA